MEFNADHSSLSRVFHEDGRTDVTQIIAAFRNFANAPTTLFTFVFSSSPTSYLLSTILSLFSYVLFILHTVSLTSFVLLIPPLPQDFFFAFFLLRP